MKQKKDHRSIPYRYGDTHTRSLDAILKSSKTLKARNSLTAADTLLNYTPFRSARRDLSFKPTIVALSPADTKFRYYRSEAQQILGQCSRGLWEGVFQI